MNYKLDGKAIESFGAHPHISQEYIALAGAFDMPKRKGTTEYNWGTSIEAFVGKEDIELDGRTLTIEVCIKGVSTEDYRIKLASYKSVCVSCRKLWTEFGEFDVVMKEAMNVEEHTDSFIAIVTAKFWQQEYLLPELAVSPTEGIGVLLDSYNLEKDFGIYISLNKNSKNIAKRIDVSTTLPYTQTQYREARDITFECVMCGADLLELYAKTGQFQALCTRPGLRKLKLAGNELYDLYFKDGMSVKVQSDTLLKFDLKCRVVT